MSLEKIIQADIVTAMKEKNENKLRTLRAIKTTIMELKTSPTFKGNRDAELSDADLIKLMQKMAKERRDVAKVYADNGRTEMADKENIEASIIEVYLPQPLTENEIKELVVEAMESVGATSMKDMGKVITYVNGKAAGRADGKIISTIVKSLLG